MYRVNLTSEAANDLASLDKVIAQRILKRLRWLASNFDAITPQPLKAQWGSMFKLRVGHYRVLYTFMLMIFFLYFFPCAESTFAQKSSVLVIWLSNCLLAL